VFLFGGLTVQHQALLRRRMRFGALAGIEVVALATSILAAIALAIVLPAKLGYWALIGRQVVMAAVTAAGVWLLCNWRPGPPARHSGAKSMLVFGGYLTGFSVVNYAARNVDNVLIGRRWHERQLGLYSKAYQLLLLPIQQINAPIASVAIPTLSRLQQEPDRYRRYYCNAMNLLAYAGTPISVAMLTLADEVIAILLGPQWEGAGRIFRVLAIAAIGQPIGKANGWVYISLGRTRRMFYWGLISVPLFVAAFVIGLPYGAIGVATGYAICELSLRVPGWLFALRGTPISLRDLWSAIRRPITLSLIMLAAMQVARRAAAGSPLWPRFAVTLAAGLVAFAAAMWLWPAARREGLKLWETAQLLRSPDPSRAQAEAVSRPGD
jgi:PST family polysaccharide transporter